MPESYADPVIGPDRPCNSPRSRRIHSELAVTIDCAHCPMPHTGIWREIRAFQSGRDRKRKGSRAWLAIDKEMRVKRAKANRVSKNARFQGAAYVAHGVCVAVLEILDFKAMTARRQPQAPSQWHAAFGRRGRLPGRHNAERRQTRHLCHPGGCQKQQQRVRRMRVCFQGEPHIAGLLHLR